MADRFPLIANSSANQIQELAAADQLNLTGSNLIFGDSSDGSSDDVLSFGASGDLKIFHQADQSRIVESGPSVLKIMGSDVRISNTGNTADYIQCNDGNNVKLYFNGGEKLATTNTGVNITGAITVNGSALNTGPLLQTKFIERTAARAVAHSGNSWAEAVESQFRVSITPSAVGNTIVCHLFLAYTCGNGTIGSMIPVYHDGSTAYSMVGGCGSSNYTVPGSVLASFGGLNEDLRNNSGNTQWFNAQKIGRYITTNTNAATIRLYSRNQAGSFTIGDNSQACCMVVHEFQGDVDFTT